MTFSSKQKLTSAQFLLKQIYNKQNELSFSFGELPHNTNRGGTKLIV
jgi:hypothetical protein